MWFTRDSRRCTILNLKKEAEPVKQEEFRLSKCPNCESYVCHMYFMQDAKTKKQSKWFSCSCGVVFQDSKPSLVYDKKYWDKYNEYSAKIEDSYKYPVRIYSPLIEELAYGRKVLLIGRQTDHQERAFADRGWIPYSIDKNEYQESSDRLFIGDFENYDFPEGLKFNMIWAYHTLECFSDPIASLSKIKSLLTEDGILFLASPDTDFINTRGSTGFIHWKPEDNHIMWNRSTITRRLENLGFNVIMCRQNYEHRFPAWDDFHLIAQKKFF